MNTVKTKDGAEIYYRDWGAGQPIVFSHGWPLSSEAWSGQMLFFAQHGYRVIAHDRRGHGRSTQTPTHNDMNSYADDLAAVTADLELAVSVDLEAQTISCGNRTYAFAIDPVSRNQLINGWDDIDLTESRRVEIVAFRIKDKQSRPWAAAPKA